MDIVKCGLKYLVHFVLIKFLLHILFIVTIEYIRGTTLLKPICQCSAQSSSHLHFVPAQTMSIEKVDKALESYYKSLNINYKNDDGVGKFAFYCDENGMIF